MKKPLTVLLFLSTSPFALAQSLQPPPAESRELKHCRKQAEQIIQELSIDSQSLQHYLSFFLSDSKTQWWHGKKLSEKIQLLSDPGTNPFRLRLSDGGSGQVNAHNLIVQKAFLKVNHANEITSSIKYGVCKIAFDAEACLIRVDQSTGELTAQFDKCKLFVVEKSAAEIEAAAALKPVQD